MFKIRIEKHSSSKIANSASASPDNFQPRVKDHSRNYGLQFSEYPREHGYYALDINDERFENIWETYDGKDVSFLNWAPYSSSSAEDGGSGDVGPGGGNGQNCAFLLNDSGDGFNGMWFPRDCSTQNVFAVCQKPKESK